MRLLILLPSQIRGGAEQYAYQIARAAAAAGWEVHGAFPRRDATASLARDFEALGPGSRYHRLEIPETDRPDGQTPSKIRARFLRTLGLLLRLRPAACFLVLPTIQYMSGSILACGWLRIPTAVCFQYIHEFPFPGGLYPFPERLIESYARARRTQRYIAISRYGRDKLARNFRMPPEAISVIYNGVASDFASLAPDERRRRRDRVRDELGLADHHVMLLTVAALRRQKGHDLLATAIGQMKDSFPNARWVWAGEGPERARLTARCESCGIADVVRLLGERRDVLDLLCAADLFVFPTRAEGGQSYALIEAMLAGVPVVASDATGIPEVIQPRRNGLLFPKENVQALKEALLEALGNPDAMRAMAQAAIEDAKAYSLENMCRQTMELLDKVRTRR